LANQDRFLLLVDDDEDVLENGRLFVEEANADEKAPFNLKLLTAQSSGDASRIINERTIDCAIIDLRLPKELGDPESEENGNQLLLNMLQELAVPFVVHSGHSAEIDINRDEYLVKIIDKEGGAFEKIISWFYGEAPLINAMSSIRKRMMRETALLFQRSILPHWKDSQKFQDGEEDLQKVILRQIASHLSEHFSLPSFGAPKHHLHEVYFRPPLRVDRIHTGDLINHEGNVHVIVTPQCNIANQYPEHLLLAMCNPMDDEVQNIRKLLADGKDGKALEKLRKLGNQQVDISEHFLPPCGEDGPWKVNFKSVQSINQDQAEVLHKNRFASISPQFIPNLVQRFSTYMGRYGQPDLNEEELAEYFR
jgi:hypothetical protein